MLFNRFISKEHLSRKLQNNNKGEESGFYGHYYLGGIIERRLDIFKDNSRLFKVFILTNRTPDNNNSYIIIITVNVLMLYINYSN